MSAASTEPLPNVEPPMWRNILLVGVGCVATLLVSWWLSRPAARPTHDTVVASAKPAEPSGAATAIPGAPAVAPADLAAPPVPAAVATVAPPKDLPLMRPRSEVAMVPLAALKSAQKQEGELRAQLAQSRRELEVAQQNLIAAQQTIAADHRRAAPAPATDAERLLRTLKPALVSSQDRQ